MGDITRAQVGSHPGYVAGTWYSPAATSGQAGAAPGVNTIRLQPFWLPKPITVSDLATRVTTAGAGGELFQLAIYASDPANPNKPGVLVGATAGQDASALALPTAATAISGGNKVMVPGLYFMAENTNSATAAFQTIYSGSIWGGAMVGSTTAGNLSTGAAICRFGYRIAQAYGTWPDLTGATMVDDTTSNNAILFFKAA